MKKLWWVGLFVLVAGFAAYFVVSKSAPKEYAIGSEEWIYHTAEAETKVRPAYFEEMKWRDPSGSAPGAVEIRGPASDDDKKDSK